MMPLYIPWLTETIKKRGVRYLLHHYLGQFFEEKLTLEQLSIDIYEGKGSIRNLALDVNGLNDELDFIPFRFLNGCLIGEISVEVPWSSLATEACRVELEGAKFVCRLKTSADGGKTHCTESTLLSKSLMTSSMQMAEDIVTTEDDDEYDSPNSSIYRHHHGQDSSLSSKRKDANQMFEGLEMFAQLIDSVLRRTKLTARNTLFQIQPHPGGTNEEHEMETGDDSSDKTPSSTHVSTSPDWNKSATGDEFGAEKSRGTPESNYAASSEGTVEFFIKFFRCEEIMEHRRGDSDGCPKDGDNSSKGCNRQGSNLLPETITKLLTLEDVEMRIGGLPVSNLIGKHTIMIKFNGQKSEISIFSGSPLLAVIGHEQLKTFFNVFDGAKDRDHGSSPSCEKNQKAMTPEDYAKIENQLLESASLRTTHQVHMGDLGYACSGSGMNRGISSQSSGRRWVESGDMFSNLGRREPDYDFHSPNSSSVTNCLDGKVIDNEPTLDNLEAFSCELKLPGIWLCILRDGEAIPPLIKPYADSINSFQTINKYIEERIKVPHIRLLALKVALDITTSGTNIFLGDLDISEHLQNDSMSPSLHLLHNDLSHIPMNSSRYKASIMNSKEITIELLAKTRIIFDPTMIDRIVYDYKLMAEPKSNRHDHQHNSHRTTKQRNHLDLNLTIRGEQFKVELLCPIPDLTPDGQEKPSQLRPQSFLFDFRHIVLSWQSDKLNISAKELIAFVKTQPKQSDSEAIKFIESSGSKSNDKIVLILEPSPSNLDTVFPNEIEQALNESSMYDSIYVGQATESRIPTEAFQTKRKVVRSNFQAPHNQQAYQASGNLREQQHEHSNNHNKMSANDCDNEKILTPGNRQHLLDYLNQTMLATKLSLSLHMPICEIEFEDKEQLDLIYNRFGNDFVFWQPKAFMKDNQRSGGTVGSGLKSRHRERKNSSAGRNNNDIDNYDDDNCSGYDRTSKIPQFKQLIDDCSTSGESSDHESEVSFHSLSVEGSNSDCYDNEVTCKISIDELFVRFNHQSCAAALKQEISAESLLLGVVLDVNKKPNTVLSLVADNLELSTDSEIVLEGNSFGDKNSIFALTAEIKRPTKALKDIKLAIQLVNGLFNDFKTDTYTRFWQSINVTDEPILGYVAPKIVTELHIDILNTALSVVREGARPALLSIDELYMTSMVMESTSQVMIRLIADEVSLYLKRDKQGLEVMKNYICLIDSGLIDLDIKYSQDGRLEFGVINNVISVRVCQDSLSALCRLFDVTLKNNADRNAKKSNGNEPHQDQPLSSGNMATQVGTNPGSSDRSSSDDSQGVEHSNLASASSKLHDHGMYDASAREMDLLEDAMNDYTMSGNEPEEGKKRNGVSNSAENDDADDDDEVDDVNDESSGPRSEEEEDSDAPPQIQTAPSELMNHRDPKVCLLDESNPLIGDFFSQPLVPVADGDDNRSLGKDELAESFRSTNKAVDESGFFVIGDDDVGAGIMDKTQHEPVVRRLTDRPINIIENHFKMTKPRTIPEMLAASIERYVLEEMTLVVNLYGGRDFDEESSNESDSTTSAATPNSTTISSDYQAEDGELVDSISMDSGSMRSRAGSVASSSFRAQQRSSVLVGGSGSKGTHFGTSGNSSDSAVGGAAGSSSSLKKRDGGPGSRRRKHLSEGSQRSSQLEQPARVRFGEGAVNLWESLDLISAPDFLGPRRPSQPPVSADSKISGGAWRQTDVCIQLTLSKVKLLYEIADSSSPISWRFMLFIHDIEIKDRIHASDINKMLYEYCTESMPKRNTQLLTIKNVATINPSDGCEECDLRVSLKPLRLNIDQDTLLFLIDFFTSLGKSLAKQQSLYGNQQQTGSVQRSSPGPAKATTGGTGSNSNTNSSVLRPRNAPTQANREQPLRAADVGGPRDVSGQVASGGGGSSGVEIRRRVPSERSDTSPSFGSCTSSTSSSPPCTTSGAVSPGRNGPASNASSNPATTTTTHRAPGDQTGRTLPTHCHKDVAANSAGGQGRQAIYIKSFTFSPDVPIRLDYHAKHLNFEQGALAGILMGLAHLDHSELVLRRVQAKHGMRGLDRVLLFTLNSWLSDIKRNQLPSILSGVGPMHSVIQLFQGMRDLIWMPIDHYRKDRRLVRGLQRGASSFSSSTAMAAINLMNRFISIVQCTAQIAHDIVTPPAYYHHHHHHHGSAQSGQTMSSGSGSRRHLRNNHLSTEDHHCAGSNSLSSHHPSCSSIVALNQPRNFCEGVAVGFTILREGFNETARNVAVGMQAEDVRCAVGELVRQIPSTLLNPIISATEGAQNVLVGIRNQIAPDARREDQEKWKRRVRGK